MAREVFVRVVDDLDRTMEAASTERLAFGGHAVELDLSRENKEKLAAFLAPYFKAGRRISGAGLAQESAPAGGISAARKLNAEIREWGNDNGWPDVQPGKMPRALKKAYLAHLAAGAS